MADLPDTSAGTPSPWLSPAVSDTLPAESTAGAETLAVHFIDVGQADCALLLCAGQSLLIDGGNVADSSLVVSYLTAQGIEYLDYVVCTHAHEDHVGGLSGPLHAFPVGAVYSPVTTYSTKAFEDFLSATEAQGLSLTVPVPGDTFALGNAAVTILGPTKDYTDTNNTSIVLRVDFDEVAFLFTGDMEEPAEKDLLASGASLWATVLKVGHHGSRTSTSYQFLREVLPTYAVISVGTGNSYGHPNEEVTSRLYDADVTVYRTDLQGNIIATSDGKEVTFTTEQAQTPIPGRDTLPAAEAEASVYIGNVNSKIFHTETCPNLPAEKNQVSFQSREEALAQGYQPCGNCKP